MSTTWDVNHEVVERWIEIGGVLNYNETHGEISLYIMDDGEFEDMWDSHPEEHSLTKAAYAKDLCRTALEFAGYTDVEVEELMDW